MNANQLLALLIVLMTLRDGALLVRHRRPSRFAFVAFWVLLAGAHFMGRSDLYPAIALILVVAFGLKLRELSGPTQELTKPGMAKPDPSSSPPGLWDRDLDGKA